MRRFPAKFARVLGKDLQVTYDIFKSSANYGEKAEMIGVIGR